MNPDAAFNKGIDYVSELTLLYGALVAFALYEGKKSFEKSEKEQAKHKYFEESFNTIEK